MLGKYVYISTCPALMHRYICSNYTSFVLINLKLLSQRKHPSLCFAIKEFSYTKESVEQSERRETQNTNAEATKTTAPFYQIQNFRDLFVRSILEAKNSFMRLIQTNDRFLWGIGRQRRSLYSFLR